MACHVSIMTAPNSLHARSYPPRLSRKYPGADHEAIALPRLDINLHVSKIGKGDSPATGAADMGPTEGYNRAS